MDRTPQPVVATVAPADLAGADLVRFVSECAKSGSGAYLTAGQCESLAGYVSALVGDSTAFERQQGD